MLRALYPQNQIFIYLGAGSGSTLGRREKSLITRGIESGFQSVVLLSYRMMSVVRKSDESVPYWWFLVNDQRDAQFFYVFIYIFNSLHVSSTSCSSSGETNCVSTTSGSCRWLCRVQVVPTCTRHSHRHRVTATRDCIDTDCLSWWWARCARNL